MTKRVRSRGLGDCPAMAFVRLGGRFPTGAMADTGSRRSIVDREAAVAAGAAPTGRTRTMIIGGKKMRGELMRLAISAIGGGSCQATIDVFVPSTGRVFRKGVLLGMDFFQASGMRIDGLTGEAYCPGAR